MDTTYKNTHLTSDERAAHLLSLMTIEEKVAQVGGIWASDVTDDTKQVFDKQKAQKTVPHGIGHISRIGGVSLHKPQQSAELANIIQTYFVNETRLGIPAVVHEENCAGYMAHGATTFPQAIGLAATWEPDLIQQMTTIIRKQMRAVGAHHGLAPVLDVARDPRWGRVEETFGEDPFLISALGVAYINGLQSDDWKNGILATAKHFLGYANSEGGLNWAPAHITPRMLREIYLTPFAAAIKNANIGSVMNGYQEIDGIPCGSSREYLVDILRGELGFTGTLVADYFTINMLADYHHIAKDKAEAAKYALLAGIDVELPANDCYGQPLIDAIHAGDIPIDLLDACVYRVIRQKIQLGLLENPYVDTGCVAEVYNTPDQIEHSRTLASKSVVLLKNENHVLPLSKSIRKIAVIGPSADNARLMQADYHFPSHLEGVSNMGENMVAPTPNKENKNINWEAYRPPTTTVLAGIRGLVGDSVQVTYAQGCSVTGTNADTWDVALQNAKDADVAIVVVGDISGLALGCSSGEAIDSATLELPGLQKQLVLAVAETGTPTIVVVLNGRPLVLTDIAEKVDALLLGWLPAQEGGSAIASVLFGDVNPAGRLPVTLPRHVGQVPIYYGHKPSGGRSHWHGNYADMPTTPLYPFGYGLSYTQFEYSNLRLNKTHAKADDVVQVQVSVKNIGSRGGDEVVQLYVHDRVASVTRPVKQLKGFKRVYLEAGQTAHLTFDLDVRHLGFYDRAMNHVVEAGTIEVMIGKSSDEICQSITFEITETACVERVYETPVTVDIR
ncbi:MAG: glycoside hydrolase family 3 C-terminal domain-containing protein [Anaerolineae bacterium]|jgi:beta-glucosidase|nr:glycoside hydrolase family 3 C-terminal domain-containing protein [Anaerolineae bacterium]